MAVHDFCIARQLCFSPCTVPYGRFMESLKCHHEDQVFVDGAISGYPVPACCVKFCPDALYGHLLAAADEEGCVRLLDTRRQSPVLLKELNPHNNAIFDVAWLPEGKQIATASGDTSIAILDVTTGTVLNRLKAHRSSVKSVDIKRDDPSMIVSSGREGNVLIWDMRCSPKGSAHRPVNCIFMAHLKTSLSKAALKRHHQSIKKGNKCLANTQCGVTAALFHGNNKVASAGATDGIVKLWDLRRTYTFLKPQPPPAWKEFSQTGDPNRPYGFSSLASNPYESCLFASCLDDCIYMYETGDTCTSADRKDPVCAFSGHHNNTFYVKSVISPDGRYLLSGSSCHRAFIWEVDRPTAPPLMLVGHKSEVTAVAWCPSQLDKVSTCSDDNDIRIWKAVVSPTSTSSTSAEFVGSALPYRGDEHLKGAQLTMDAKRSKQLALEASPPPSKRHCGKSSLATLDAFFYC